MSPLAFHRKLYTPVRINPPVLTYVRQPALSSVIDYGGSTTLVGIATINYVDPADVKFVSTTYNGYPVRGYLYVPATGIGTAGPVTDTLVLYHGTIDSQNTTPFQAANTFMRIVIDPNKINVRDKIIFSVAYPQDAIPAWLSNPSLSAQQFGITNLSGFYLGDNLPYARSALQWVQSGLNTYFSDNSIDRTVGNVYTFGHSQGGLLVHRLNTLSGVSTVTGVIANAPGPIDLLSRCANSEANGDDNISCRKLKTGYGSTINTPNVYDNVSLKNYLSGTKAPMLFTQALDDTTGDASGTPQVANMQNIVQPGLSTCGTCNTSTFNYYAYGGHDAFNVNPTLQSDIRSFLGSSPTDTSFIGIGTIGYEWKLNSSLIGVGTQLSLTNMTDVDYNFKTLTQYAIYYPDPTRVGIQTFQPGASNSPLASNEVTLRVRGQITITSQPSAEGGEDYVEQGLLDISPATPNGTTTINILSGDFTDFASDITYTLTPKSTFVARFTLNGAKGGSAAGGNGGNVVGEVVLESGKTYQLVVGKAGSLAGTTGAGGGGRGFTNGGSGGGFTGLFLTSVTQSNAILIAGGGGGGSTNRSGGAGGGLNGSNGDGGGGGTQTAGGAAYAAGENGSALKGGDGQDTTNGGGAGGGGYFGGGAARGDSNFTPGPYGGGGGSGYIHPQLVSNGSFGSAANTGGGTVTISKV